MKRHNFSGKICHWWFCVHCGFIWLHNKASDKVAKGACRNGED